MSAASNIVAFDGAATPISHTFVPIGNEVTALAEFVAKWRENLTSVAPDNNCKFRTSFRRLKNGYDKVVCTLEVPYMETISGQNASGYTAAAKQAYVNTHIYIGFLHQRSTTLERRTGRQLFMNIMNGVSVSVAPVNTGPVAELVDSSIVAQ